MVALMLAGLLSGPDAFSERPASTAFEAAKTLDFADLAGPHFVLGLDPAFGGRWMVLSGYRLQQERRVAVLRLETVDGHGETEVKWAQSDQCPAVGAFLVDGAQMYAPGIALPFLEGQTPRTPMADGVWTRFHASFVEIDGKSASLEVSGNTDSPAYRWWDRNSAALMSCWTMTEPAAS